MRINKYIASAGICSRRKADELISNGNVKVNGAVLREPGYDVKEGDHVEVNGTPVIGAEKPVYYLLNKPAGYVTTAKDEQDRATVLDLVADIPERVFPVGRLDYDSEGLLLLTNDGDMMNRVLHPSREVSKKYLTKVSNQVSEENIQLLRHGVLIDGRMTSPASVRLIRRETFDTVLLISIHEGRNRQIRKMINAIGHQVVSLRRVEFGPVSLGDLPVGKWRNLTEQEIQQLKAF